MIHARRKDNNHSQLVAHAKSLGFFVWETYQLPKCCDCVMIRNGHVFFVEIKDGSKPPSKKKLTPEEAIFRAQVEEQKGRYVIAENENDINQLYTSTL